MMATSSPNSILATHMGEAFFRLSPLLQRAHQGKTRLSGKAKVSRGNFVAHLICEIFRFPKSGDAVDLTVDREHSEQRMSWNRNFAGLKMYSYFSRRGEFLVEYLGPMALGFKASEVDGALRYDFSGTRFLGIPLPNFMSPQVDAGEREENSDYVFHVNVQMFLVGPVISYSGKLKVEVIE